MKVVETNDNKAWSELCQSSPVLSTSKHDSTKSGQIQEQEH